MDPNTKNALSISIIVTVVSFVLVQLIMGGNPMGQEAMYGGTYSYGKILTSLGIGCVIGGAAFGVLKMISKS